MPLAASLRVGVAIFSYEGLLTFGITGDYDTAPDIDVLRRGIEAGITDLVNAAKTGLSAPVATRAASSRSSR